jgi:hypothetical protein
MNVGRISIENEFGFLKIGGGSYIASMHMLIKSLELWWLVISFITIAN